VLLLVCWWPFNYTGYPLSWRSALVMVWGGLRGAVGMVMALFIFLDTRIHDASFKSYCIFYMGTMAFFTVLINGGSTKVCIRVLAACRKAAPVLLRACKKCIMVC
jgi:NhaP-type Na+/H+ or K+/H+ antiporter